MAGRVTLLASAFFVLGRIALDTCAYAHAPSPRNASTDLDNISQENDAKCYPEKVNDNHMYSRISHVICFSVFPSSELLQLSTRLGMAEARGETQAQNLYRFDWLSQASPER